MSLKSVVSALTTKKMAERSWLQDENVFTKTAIDGTIYAVTMLTGHSNLYRLPVPSYMCKPTIFLINEKIEQAYAKYQERYGKIFFTRAVGTICVHPTYVKLGAPSFFAKPIPDNDPSNPMWISRNSWDESAWMYFAHNDVMSYQIFVPAEVSTPVNEQNPELLKMVEAMIHDIDTSNAWLKKAGGSYDLIVELARYAASDFNKAILFGPNWLFKVPFILLLAGDFKSASLFRSAIGKYSLRDLFRLDTDAAEKAISDLFNWGQSLEKETQHIDADDPESFCDHQIPKLKVLIDKKQKNEGIIPDRRLIPFTTNQPGLIAEIQQNIKC